MRKRHKYLLVSTIVLAAVVIPILTVTPAKKQTVYLNRSGLIGADPVYKKVTFGFNLGFLSDVNQQSASFLSAPLQQIKSDGITDVRVYEPFTTGLVKNSSTGPSDLAWLTGQGFHVLLSLSDYPDVPSITYDKSVPPKTPSDTSFTNRYPPTDVQGQYIPYLTNYLDNLPSSVIANTDFEIGNEPDAPEYFWGTPQKFVDIATATKAALQKYNRPIYCCGFTSKFSDNTAPRDPGYGALLNDNSFFSDVNLSFHSYQYDENTGFPNISLPHEANSIITEFNMWSYQKQDSASHIATMNSASFTSWIIQLLDYAYAHDIKKVYVFSLADNPKKDGALGLFDSTGQPKPAYSYFKTIYDVIKDGYAIDDSDTTIHLIGKTKSAWFAKSGTLTLPATESVLSVSDASAALASLVDVHTVGSGQWAITETIVPTANAESGTGSSDSSSDGSDDGNSGGSSTPPPSNPAVDTVSSGGNASGGGYVVPNTPVQVTQATNQPLSNSVSSTINFSVTQPTHSTPAPSKSTVPTPVETATPPSVTGSSTEVVSIEYALDDEGIHTTTTFPDTWSLDTTTLTNGWHTLQATYHYGDGSTRDSISLFNVQNKQTFFEHLSNPVLRGWDAVARFFGNLF